MKIRLDALYLTSRSLEQERVRKRHLGMYYLCLNTWSSHKKERQNTLRAMFLNAAQTAHSYTQNKIFLKLEEKPS